MKIKYPPLWWWLFCIIGIGTIFCFAFVYTPELLKNYVFHFRVLSCIVALIHLLEAAYVYWLAAGNQMGKTTILWTLQTLVCGLMSIQLLQKVIQEKKGDYAHPSKT